VYGTPDDATFAQLAGQLENSGAEAVLLPDTLEASARFLSALSSAAKRRIRPLGTALWDSAVKIANSQAIFERALFVSPFFPQSTRPVVQQFVESYRGKFQSTPNFLAAQGFDVGTLVVNALRQSLRDNAPFAESLSRLPPYNGVTGFISSSAPGELKRLFYVVEVTRESFLEKAPSGDPQVTRETITYRGNQQVDSRTQQLVRSPEATVASGY
jgi:ABC-type branched-subunit amino acid transport system substrate-binding protein